MDAISNSTIAPAWPITARDEHALLHGERGVRIGDGGHCRRRHQWRRPGLQFDGYGIIGKFRGDVKRAQNLDGVKPRFERAALFAEDRPVSPATVNGFPPSTGRVMASGLACTGKRGMGCNADTFQAPVAKAEISQKPSLRCLTQGGVRRVSRKVERNAIAALSRFGVGPQPQCRNGSISRHNVAMHHRRDWLKLLAAREFRLGRRASLRGQ